MVECSKSYGTDSPLGGGPIVRVGDRTSTFDPDLTYRVSRVAADLARRDGRFKWQRKLMPGGTCEATAYQALGYTAACVCLPLGRYHNMNEGVSTRDSARGRVDAETIALSDFHGLIRLLVELERAMDAPDQSLRSTLNALFDRRRTVLVS